MLPPSRASHAHCARPHSATMAPPRGAIVAEPEREPSRRVCCICGVKCVSKCDRCKDVFYCRDCWPVWWRDHVSRCMEPEHEPLRHARPEPSPEPTPTVARRWTRSPRRQLQDMPVRIIEALQLRHLKPLKCTSPSVLAWCRSEAQVRGFDFRRSSTDVTLCNRKQGCSTAVAEATLRPRVIRTNRWRRTQNII